RAGRARRPRGRGRSRRRAGAAGRHRGGRRPRSGRAPDGGGRRAPRPAAGVFAMTPIALTVHGQRLQAPGEPRTPPADFPREHCRLTGTHLGCEHGVCGACTVLIDGEPARACIAFAVACDGLAVETIEGFDSDPVMGALREAFAREHGLQCGFCTPGMLIAARDVVRRLPGADVQRIRVGPPGTLCRCTGYLGIVNAVHAVAQAAGAPPAEAATPVQAAAAAGMSFATFVPREAGAAGIDAD